MTRRPKIDWSAVVATLRSTHGDGGCWPWPHGKCASGYGVFNFRDGDGKWRTQRVHRLAYERFVGPIPERHDIDHLCRNRACCNPRHLEAVTRGENVLRGSGIAVRNAEKSHCEHGHELAGDNLRITPRGFRACRACARTFAAQYRRQRRESAA